MVRLSVQANRTTFLQQCDIEFSVGFSRKDKPRITYGRNCFQKPSQEVAEQKGKETSPDPSHLQHRV